MVKYTHSQMILTQCIKEDQYSRYRKYIRSLSNYDYQIYHLNGNEEFLSKTSIFQSNHDEIMIFTKTLNLSDYKVEILYTRLAKPGKPCIKVFYFPISYLSKKV